MVAVAAEAPLAALLYTVVAVVSQGEVPIGSAGAEVAGGLPLIFAAEVAVVVNGAEGITEVGYVRGGSWVIMGDSRVTEVDLRVIKSDRGGGDITGSVAYLTPRHSVVLGSTAMLCIWSLVLWCTGRLTHRCRPTLAGDSTYLKEAM